MAQDFKLPELGENIEAGDVVSVLVAEGDQVAEDQGVLELETDKATVEVPSEVSGKVTKVHVGEGDRVEVGQTIFSYEAADSEEAAKPEEEEEAAAEEEAAEEAETPEKKEAESAPAEKEEVDSSSEKTSEKEEEDDEDESGDRGGEVVEFRERKKAQPSKVVPASPAVRRFAREIGIDIEQVSGSGPKGRISREDVKAFARKSRSAGAASAVPAADLPDFTRFGEVRREGFSNVRRATARHLAKAWAHVVHVTNHDEADVTHLEELRKKYAPRVEAEGGKLTVTAIVLKVAVAALKRFAKFNASIDVREEEVVYKNYYHLGVAVDTERGLLVPVIRDVDQKSITDISLELKEVAERARQGKIGPGDLEGGCFTITNLGGIGGTSFTPIVNFPEVAILGLSRTQTKPVWQDGEFRPRKILPLSLSYDHRLVDGADAARFLRWFSQALEDPFLLMLES